MPSRSNVIKPKSATETRAEFLRAEAIGAVLDLEDALVRTRSQLKSVHTVIRRSRLKLQAGRSCGDVSSMANLAQGRAATSAMIREVQEARHRAQRASFKLAAAEGKTMAEIAREWGVSRQLVSRMVKEPSPGRKKG